MDRATAELVIQQHQTANDNNDTTVEPNQRDIGNKTLK